MSILLNMKNRVTHLNQLVTGASQHGSFQDYCNRPLYHLSSASIFLKAGAKVRVFLELTKFYSDFLHKRMKNRTFAA